MRSGNENYLAAVLFCGQNAQLDIAEGNRAAMFLQQDMAVGPFATAVGVSGTMGGVVTEAIPEYGESPPGPVARTR